MTDVIDSPLRNNADRWRDALRSGVAVAIGVIALLEIADEMLSRRRRAIRAVNSWWSGVERRQQRETHKAEVGFLARLVSPH